MDKRALVGLLVVPVVLSGAMVWARHRAWESLEEDFRQQIISSAARSSLHVSLHDEKKGRFESLGDYQVNELKDFLSDVHLVRADGKGFYSENSFRCDVDATAFSGGIGFELGVERDEGAIVDSFDPTIMGYKWQKHLTISPESCRALKKRLRAKFGDNPQGTRIPPQ